MGPLLSALHFLTTIPLLPHRPFSHEEFGRAVGYFPLVGLVIGALLVGAKTLLGLIFPPQVMVVLTLALWVILTGGLHLDGFLDSLDGLLGGYDETSRLNIMRDERVGAYGLAGGVLLLLLKYSLLLALVAAPTFWYALVLAPTLGRWALAIAIAGFPYARKQGLGRGIKDFTTWRQVVLATTITVLGAVITAQWVGAFAVGIAGGTVWLSARFTLRRIPGLTGDVYGAICEITECVVLMVLVIGWQF